MKKIILFAAAAIIISTLTGCTHTAPIAQIHTTVSAGHTEPQVKNAILKAGAQRKWTMSEAAPGEIKARQQARSHVVEIRISYTATSYSINYSSSLNLMAAGGQIHRNYNLWVHDLDKDIQLNLAAGPML